MRSPTLTRWLRRTMVVLVGLAIVGLAWSGNAQAPSLKLEQSLDPASIAVRGAGDTDTASMTLTIRAPETDSSSLDVILALDRSASVDLSRVQHVAHTVVDHLAPGDQAGIVSFANRAGLDQALTDDRTTVREAIRGLESDSLTALGDGLRLAIDKLTSNGRSDAQSLLVLLTDGVNLTGRSALPEAARAAEHDIPIMAIGAADSLRTRIMHNVAREANGVFYERFSMDVLESVFRRVDRPVVARSLQLRDTIASKLNYAGAEENAPSVLPGDAVTQFEWHTPTMFAGEVWTTTYRLSGDAAGTYRLHRRPSGLSYRNSSGNEVDVAFPKRLQLTVQQP